MTNTEYIAGCVLRLTNANSTITVVFTTGTIISGGRMLMQYIKRVVLQVRAIRPKTPSALLHRKEKNKGGNKTALNRLQ